MYRLSSRLYLTGRAGQHRGSLAGSWTKSARPSHMHPELDQQQPRVIERAPKYQKRRGSKKRSPRLWIGGYRCDAESDSTDIRPGTVAREARP
jgi:hypothetical protein